MSRLSDRLAGTEVVDLAHPLHRGMPVSPNHPPFQMTLMRRHGDMVRADGGSAANEIIVTGGHVGTHLDALGHASHDGMLHGGLEAEGIQSHEGLAELGIETVRPLITRGVLLDVAAVHGVDVLEPGREITAADLEAAAELAGAAPGKGDAVLIRTGWATHSDSPDSFRGLEAGTPGPGEEAARWLADREILVAGAETIAFEVIRPGAGHSVLPVHRILLVEAGIHIIEVMDLSRLAATGVFDFAFLAIPLKIVGATGSPVRPIALLDG
jgi:kynurenine formamidase